MKPDISNFDSLPEVAQVPATVLAAVLGIGLSTAWRRAKEDPDFPRLIVLGPKCTRASVGEIRAYIARRRSQGAAA